ncbi:hypothetical protein Vadar_017110 [Vaccinium darrowii]|uniref:Uncharacterized protein n=1 Tax=Vaccinium darrowii TaxID=229202 RepID=A0ACB7ZM76_9ERIC|nr:hypothetical protein Vadar_017110 [Vaccinium darrowii]
MAMQSFAMKGQNRARELLRLCRGLSLVAEKEAIAHEIESPIPKMPPFDYAPPPYNGPSAAEILQKRKKFLSPSMFYFYNNTPLNVVDGKMQYLYDDTGRRYLDAFGGIATVCCGHCHPDVVKAIVNQTNRLQHSTILYLNPAIADFAEALASKMPGDLKVVFFTNSGTEANELAMMIARLVHRVPRHHITEKCIPWECSRDNGGDCTVQLEIQYCAEWSSPCP